MAPQRHKHVLYVIEGHGGYKVGIAEDLGRRLAVIQTYNAQKVRVATYRSVPKHRTKAIEKAVHFALAEYHLHGEWFAAPLELIKVAMDEAIARDKAVPGVWEPHWHLNVDYYAAAQQAREAHRAAVAPGQPYVRIAKK